MRKISYFPVRNSNLNLIINKCYVINKYSNEQINKSLKILRNWVIFSKCFFKEKVNEVITMLSITLAYANQNIFLLDHVLIKNIRSWGKYDGYKQTILRKDTQI